MPKLQGNFPGGKYSDSNNSFDQFSPSDIHHIRRNHCEVMCDLINIESFQLLA
jgi:hypothetical protein